MYSIFTAPKIANNSRGVYLSDNSMSLTFNSQQEMFEDSSFRSGQITVQTNINFISYSTRSDSYTSVLIVSQFIFLTRWRISACSVEPATN